MVNARLNIVAAGHMRRAALSRKPARRPPLSPTGNIETSATKA
jgi:hypothetical protein